MFTFDPQKRAVKRLEQMIRRYADSRDPATLPLVKAENKMMPCWNYSSTVRIQGSRIIVETSLPLPIEFQLQMKQVWPDMDVIGRAPVTQLPSLSQAVTQQ